MSARLPRLTDAELDALEADARSMRLDTIKRLCAEVRETRLRDATAIAANQRKMEDFTSVLTCDCGHQHFMTDDVTIVICNQCGQTHDIAAIRKKLKWGVG